MSKKLNDLSLTRRAMHFAMKNGVTTQQQFAKDTGTNMSSGYIDTELTRLQDSHHGELVNSLWS